VDLVVGRFAWQSRILERARQLSVGEFSLPVVGAADLVLLKLFAGGSQDAWDIVQVLAAPGRGELVAEVESRLTELPPLAATLWSRILGDEKA
jgi:hypothetical protein